MIHHFKFEERPYEGLRMDTHGADTVRWPGGDHPHTYVIAAWSFVFRLRERRADGRIHESRVTTAEACKLFSQTECARQMSYSLLDVVERLYGDGARYFIQQQQEGAIPDDAIYRVQ